MTADFQVTLVDTVRQGVDAKLWRLSGGASLSELETRTGSTRFDHGDDAVVVVAVDAI